MIRLIMLTLVLSCFAWGCEKEIHEAKTPLRAPVVASAQ